MINQINEIKNNGNHITAELSYADLIQLGGICAVQYCGGPQVLFKMGRQDISEEDHISYAAERLPDPYDKNSCF